MSLSDGSLVAGRRASVGRSNAIHSVSRTLPLPPLLESHQVPTLEAVQPCLSSPRPHRNNHSLICALLPQLNRAGAVGGVLVSCVAFCQEANLSQLRYLARSRHNLCQPSLRRDCYDLRLDMSQTWLVILMVVQENSYVATRLVYRLEDSNVL